MKISKTPKDMKDLHGAIVTFLRDYDGVPLISRTFEYAKYGYRIERSDECNEYSYYLNDYSVDAWVLMNFNTLRAKHCGDVCNCDEEVGCYCDNKRSRGFYISYCNGNGEEMYRLHSEEYYLQHAQFVKTGVQKYIDGISRAYSRVYRDCEGRCVGSSQYECFVSATLAYEETKKRLTEQFETILEYVKDSVYFCGDIDSICERALELWKEGMKE